MNDAVRRVADAVLYEGYILYPYRPSVKNRQRWTFGGLYPPAYCAAQRGSDAAGNQTECLVEGDPGTSLDVTIRFLHLTERAIGEIVPPLPELPADPAFRVVESLRVGEQTFHTWQEAEERTVELTSVRLGEIADRPHCHEFTLSGRRWLEPLRGPGGIVGVLVREQQAVEGAIEVSAAAVDAGLYRVTLRVKNRTGLVEHLRTDRDAALLRALVSTHAVLTNREGAFVSLIDPPERWRAAAAGCNNIGTWPVLVGEDGARDAVLSSPIILPEYPQVAPESPGDLFDSAEIDEILTLRILTLTDEEKQAAAAIDGRARDLMARTEALAREQLAALHGTLRGLRPIPGDRP